MISAGVKIVFDLLKSLTFNRVDAIFWIKKHVTDSLQPTYVQFSIKCGDLQKYT